MDSGVPAMFHGPLPRFQPLDFETGPEIHQDDAAVTVAHDVLGLHVAMHEVGAVHRRERPADVLTDQHRLRALSVLSGFNTPSSVSPWMNPCTVRHGRRATPRRKR